MSQNSKGQKNADLIIRPPIVAVMGHIDHGKTKLLDYIRKTNVIEKEAGGITQSIGAYEAQVATKEGDSRRITFIDTPGHEAFSKMRSRGAKVADIAVLVIAADDGVKPQTKEALGVIEQADLPYVVAVNKIDKPQADIEKIKKELSENNILIEEWGGEVPLVPISAKEGAGMEDLLETIILLSDLEDFKANPQEKASGVVIESRLDSRRGNTATLIIRNGTLRAGQYVVAGEAFSPVRIFEDFTSHILKEATFSSPVLVAGFNKLPEVGSSFISVDNKKEAEKTIKASGTEVLRPRVEITEGVEEKEGGQVTAVPIIIKADSAGSLEAVEQEIRKFESNDIVVKILKSEVGNINEDDIKFAISAENPIVVGFAVGIEKNVEEIADVHGIKIGIFDIIYELLESVKKLIEDRLPEQVKEEVVGRARVLKIFSVKGDKQVVGGRVLSGSIKEGGAFKLLRRDNVLKEGKILELQHNKIKVKEVEEGSEFGALATVGVEVAPKDELEVIEKSKIERRL